MDIRLFNGLIYYLRNGHTHDSETNEELRKSIERKVHNYFTINGLLFFHEKNKLEEPRLVIHAQGVERVLREGHGGLSGGHFGTEITYKKLRKEFYWPNMYKMVEDYVQTCPVCQRKGKPKKVNELRPITVSRPFELIGIDMVGPLKLTNSGNRYIIVMTEYLTKWVEAKAVPNKEAGTVAEFLYNNVITRYGTPERMITDQGKEFENETIKALQTVMNIKGVHSTPYHPQSNGQVERTNKTLCDTLKAYTIEKGDEWDRWLPSTLYAYRTMTQSSTKFTPSSLLYGFEMKTPIILDKYKDLPDKERLIQTAREYANLVEVRLDKTRNVAKDNIRKAQEVQKHQFDKKVKKDVFKEGDEVLMRDSAQDNVHGNKFEDKYKKGTFKIVQNFGNGTYKIQENQPEYRVLKKPISGDKLKRYRSRPFWEVTIPIDKPRTHVPIKKPDINKIEQFKIDKELERREKLKKDKVMKTKSDLRDEEITEDTVLYKPQTRRQSPRTSVTIKGKQNTSMKVNTPTVSTIKEDKFLRRNNPSARDVLSRMEKSKKK